MSESMEAEEAGDEQIGRNMAQHINSFSYSPNMLLNYLFSSLLPCMKHHGFIWQESGVLNSFGTDKRWIIN